MRRGRLDPALAKALGKPADEAAPGHRAGLCAAYGCRLPGSMAESSGSRSWWCAFHYSANSVDLPRITQVLLQNSALVTAMLASREFHASPAAATESGQKQWDEAAEMVERAGYQVRPAKSFRAFAIECETILGGLVVKSLTKMKERGAT